MYCLDVLLLLCYDNLRDVPTCVKVYKCGICGKYTSGKLTLY